MSDELLQDEGDISAADTAAADQYTARRTVRGWDWAWRITHKVEIIARIECLTIDSGGDSIVLEGQQGRNGIDRAGGGVAVTNHCARHGKRDLSKMCPQCLV